MDQLPPHDPAGSDSYISYSRLLYAGDGSVSQITVHEPSGWIPEIREEVIQDIWSRQEFDVRRLATTDGRPVTVRDPGRPNTDGGPDFKEARIVIDDLEWFGDVEIHRSPAGWYRHGHDTDPAYNRVVLHVSLRGNDSIGRLRRHDRSVIPEVVLQPYLTTPVRNLLYRFYSRPYETTYCESMWDDVPVSLRRGWIRRLGIERLESRKEQFAQAYLTHGDLQVIAYRGVFRALGYSANEAPMQSLAERVPLDVADRFAADPSALEGLFFGMAGFLSGVQMTSSRQRADGGYVERLREHFDGMRSSLDRPPMDRTAWQFFRLRPANFPTLRIAQGAALLRRGRLLHGDCIGHLTRAIESDDPVARCRALLRVEPPEFWRTHLRLDRRTKPRRPTLGTSRADTVAINVLLPVLRLYAEQQEDISLADRIEDVLGSFAPDRDHIIRRFRTMGARPSNALETQGIHQLYRTRCSRGRCLQCGIGRYILEDG